MVSDAISSAVGAIGGWFSNMIREFFFAIDSIIYGAIEKVYDLFEVISTTTIMSQDQISSLGDRIYDLLAIFMIFKVTLSLITYVVSPNSFNDGKSGIGALTRNVVLVLALLVLTPYAFNLAFKAQKTILADNIIPKLIFGEETSNGSITNAGEKMSFIAMSAFIYPDSAVVTECADLVVDGKINPECSGWSGGDTITSSTTEAPYKTLGDVANALTKDEKDQSNFTEVNIKNYVTGFNNSSFALAYRSKLVTAKTVEGSYVFNYSWLLSTAVGVVILLLLINFCMDVAVRSIKLSFLQLIAPVPIISFIDPKSGKDGMFKKWYKMCFSVYLSLFIRLFIIYFVVYIINLIGDSNLSNVVTGEQVTGFWLKLFMMIGALMFAKQMPKILEGLGIKLDSGGFTLNPLKKVEKDALGGKQLLGGAKGLAAGAMIGTAGMLTGAGIGRSLTGTFGGLKSGIQGKKFGEIRKDQVARNAEMRRAIASGSSIPERFGARTSSFFGTPGRLGEIEHQKIDRQNKIDTNTAKKKDKANQIAQIKRAIEGEKTMQGAISSMEKRAQDKIRNGEGRQGEIYLKKKAQYDYLAANGGTAEQLAAAEADMVNYVNDEGMKSFMSDQSRYSNFKIDLEQKLANHEITQEQFDIQLEKGRANYKAEFGITDDAFDNMYKDYVQSATQIGQEIKSAGGDLHVQLGVSKGRSGDMQRSINPIEGEIKVLDDEINALNNELAQLNVEERDAKASVQAVHGTEGGPSRPSEIKQATHTVGYRVGGEGSGVSDFLAGEISNDVHSGPQGGPPPGPPGPGPR